MRQLLSKVERTAIVASGIAVALTLAGCKNDQGTTATPPSEQATQPSHGTAPGSQTPPAPPVTPSGKANLTITVRMSPSAKPVTHTLTCGPAGGTVPQAAVVCEVLAKVAAAKGGDPFAPTPTGQMCTQIFAGPQVAQVKGTWNGRPVDAKFTRVNGCETKRWNDLAPLFGPIPKTIVTR